MKIASIILLAGLVSATGINADDHPAIVVNEFIYEHAPYPSAHASTIVETTSHELVAAWFGGTRERN
ncbi:MAG TPA: hypothetical protein VFP90_11685, partial [Gemmatimonadaceae bacterium]|nr:hypothetical protein [Gemmatimonadaceae bacterium]